MSKEFWLPKPSATTKLIKATEHSAGVRENGLRVYRCAPESVMVQWRVGSKSGMTGSGILAQGILSYEEVQRLRDYLAVLLMEFVP